MQNAVEKSPWTEIEKRLPAGKNLLGAKEIGTALEICHVTAGKLMKDPSFPAVTIGARRKIARPVFLEWLKCQR